VHALISIPPKYAVLQVVDFFKVKSAIHIAVCTEKGNEISLPKASGLGSFFVTTVGRDEAVIREYIKNQEVEDSRLEQLNLWR
jgi:putative transposase